MMLDEDWVAAYHEAAHAVVAHALEYLVISGDVSIMGRGHGQTGISMDFQKVNANIENDIETPRLNMIRMLMAGAAVEHHLVAKGLADIRKEDIAIAAAPDQILLNEQVRKLGWTPNWQEFREELVGGFNDHSSWCVIERFAKILHDRRTIPGPEATAIIGELSDACDAEYSDEQSQDEA